MKNAQILKDIPFPIYLSNEIETGEHDGTLSRCAKSWDEVFEALEVEHPREVSVDLAATNGLPGDNFPYKIIQIGLPEVLFTLNQSDPDTINEVLSRNFTQFYKEDFTNVMRYQVMAEQRDGYLGFIEYWYPCDDNKEMEYFERLEKQYAQEFNETPTGSITY